MLLHKGTCLFKKRNGIQDKKITLYLSEILMDCHEGKQVKEAFKYGYFICSGFDCRNIFW